MVPESLHGSVGGQYRPVSNHRYTSPENKGVTIKVTPMHARQKLNLFVIQAHERLSKVAQKGIEAIESTYCGKQVFPGLRKILTKSIPVQNVLVH